MPTTSTPARSRKQRAEKVYVEEIDRTLFCNRYGGTPRPGATVRTRRRGSFRAGLVLDVTTDAGAPSNPFVTILTVTGKTLRFRYHRAGDGFRLVPAR